MFTGILIGLSVGLAGGVVLSKYVSSDAAVVTQHVTSEITRLRNDFRNALQDLKK